ncbi:MAG: TonB-dependent receptor plug [Deltaproteobacteria bacterium]|nr:TonB-dependent receptor plug [Deltaproteobacteria bacterium]
MNNKVLKASFLAFGAMGLFGTSSLLAPHQAFAQSSSTVGSLRGQLKDKATGEAAIGATVVATSPALVGEQVVITDDTGQYFIGSLPPGVYTLTIYYNNQPFSRSNVLIQVGKEVVVNVAVDSSKTTGKPGGEIIVITGSVPIIDQGSTKTGTTLTEDYTRNVPTGRTFGGVLGSAAGSQGDTYGTSISGATSAENTYIVEGINTTDTAFGGLSSNLPNEFVSETEVITGGYNAEYGRATGGIVNVVTKQGSNTIHGSVFGYLRPSAFIADSNTIQREGSSIDSQTNLNYNYDVGAEIGGPIIKDKLWFHVGFNPSFQKQTTTRLIQSQVDKDGDGVADVDANGFAIHELVSESDIPANFNTYFFTAKINGAVNQNNQFQVSAFGNPRNAKDVFGVTRNPAATRWKYDDGAYDLSGKWTSKLNEGKTQVDAVVGFHRGIENQKPFDAAGDVALVFERANHTRDLFDFLQFEGASNIGNHMVNGELRGCEDGVGSDPYPMIQNCPTLGYATQGIGFLEKRTSDRTSAILSVTQRVKAAGYHTFKAGIDAEFSTYNSTRRYTGAQIFRKNTIAAARPDGSFQSTWQLREFMKVERNLSPEEIMDPGSVTLEANQLLCANDRAVCGTADRLQADTNNRGIAGYLQDSWQIRPNFTVNAGLRLEQQVGYAAKALQGSLTPTNEIVPKEAYNLNDLVAPRLGFIYDPTQDGKSKIFGHWGRFYENVPMDLNVRAFGGEITNFTVLNARRLSNTDPAFDPNCRGDVTTVGIANTLNQCTDRSPQALLGEGTEFVSPGLKGQYTQELILGTEYEVANNLKFGVNYIHRTMPRVIEDVSTDGGNNYLITNPSENLDAESRALDTQAAKLLMEGGCNGTDMENPDCNLDKLALANLQSSRADQLLAVKKFDKPSRNYDAVQLTATQRPTKQSLLIASYTYSVSKGNYPGLFSTETGQLDPNITSLYDLPDLMANRYGNMGLDRPHNLKVDGFYRFDLKKVGLVTTGGSFRAQSGIPNNVLAAHPTYGTGEAYVLPRGVNGRSPVTTQFDVHLSYGRQLNKTTIIEAFVNVFNLLNQQKELGVDDNYTFDFTNPIVGGDLNDALHAKVLDGRDTNTTVTPNKNFGHLNAHQSSRNVQLGVRLTF